MKTFEERLERLEKLADLIRDRNTPIEEAMKLFDEGALLSRKLEGELEGYEQKVEMLMNEPPEDGSGEAELGSFGDGSA